MNRSRWMGYGFGVLTALSWAISPIFIRKGLEGLPSSLWGVTVGLVSATGVYFIWLLFRRISGRGSQEDRTPAMLQPNRKLDAVLTVALFIQVLAGVAAGLGTVGRTVAIELAPIVVAIPLAQTSSIFTLIFAPLLLGTKIERVTFKLAFGALLVVAGSALVVIGRNR
jgi:drug/metabolite transporter (DMT)-like permease